MHGSSSLVLYALSSLLVQVKGDSVRPISAVMQLWALGNGHRRIRLKCALASAFRFSSCSISLYLFTSLLLILVCRDYTNLLSIYIHTTLVMDAAAAPPAPPTPAQVKALSEALYWVCRCSRESNIADILLYRATLHSVSKLRVYLYIS